MDVLVVLTVGAEGATLFYRPDNLVRIEGQIDMTLIPQLQSTVVQGKLSALEADWKTGRAALEAQGASETEREQQLRQALRRYHNQRAAIAVTPLRSVVAGYVELVVGEGLSEDALIETTRAGRRRAEGACGDYCNTSRALRATEA